MLHGIDLQSLAMYCREMSIYHFCMDIVQKEGVVKAFENGAQRMDQINPHYKVAKIALDNANKLADKFGFNPSARASLKAAPQQAKSAEMNLLRLAK
jgi:P27 family predicted phage terminase small subunit